MAVKSTDLTRAVTEINEHADEYRLADNFYRGKVEEVFAGSSRIVRLLKEAGKHFRTNLAATPVDAVLNGLEITSVTIPNASGEVDQKMTDIFKEKVWDANELDLYLPDWLREIGKEGDAYLMVWEGAEDNTCEIHVRKPVSSRMFYDEENPREKLFYAYLWKVKGNRKRVNLLYPDRVEKYLSKIKDPKSADDFDQYEEDGDGGWPVTHGYDEVAAFHGRSDHPYGVPDHYNAYGPQNQLNKVIATHMSSVDFVGFPQRAALQDAPIEDDGDLWDQDDNEGTGGTGIPDTDDESKLVSHPGSLWLLKNTKSLVSLPAADADNFLKPIDKAAQLMSAATGTPIRFFNGTQGQQPSGASLREDDNRLNSRRAMRILLAGAALRDAFTFAMRKVLGYTDCPEVVINWKPVRRAELLDEWQTIQAKQEAGVPRDVTLLEAGYTPSQISDWNASAPDPGKGLEERIALMERLAGAAEKLAAAAELGALDMSVVQSLMAGFLPAPEDEDGNPLPAPPPQDEGPTPKQLAEMVQKIYLGVPTVLSREEARRLLADSGFDIDPGAPAPVE